MKNETCLPRIIALALLALIILPATTGCVSSRYKKAKKQTPPALTLNVTFAPGTLEASLTSLITYNGPGAWKRNAYWDEYVVTLRNAGTEPLVVSGSELVDHTGAGRMAGLKPWELEKESKTLERKYQEAGIAFVRYTAPGVLIAGTGFAAAMASGPLISFGPAAAGAGAGATIAAATVIVLPVYYIAVLTINHNNKVGMEKEFHRRRLVLPLTLAPGEIRTGSLFFPMVASPRSLHLQWSAGATRGESELPLDFLGGLHTAPAKGKPL